MGPPGDTVFVEAHARLHFGVLDLRGSLGRWFGGIGAAAPAPTLRLSARVADAVAASGPDADRAAKYARRFLTHHGITTGADVVVERSLPAHSGLGSGTQLALAVGRALAELYALPVDPVSLSLGAGRARRSAIGTWVFAAGGLVVEGGRPREGNVCGPLVSRIELPQHWHCVVAVPSTQSGMSGQAEAQAFSDLPAPPQHEVEHVAYVVLMSLLPAAAEDDLPTFGSALTEIQRITGRWFAPVQGDTFAPGPTRDLIELMIAEGAAGAGQSSWGPAVYGIVDGAVAAERLAVRVRATSGDAVAIYSGPFPSKGARIWRNSSTVTAGP
jgi:beta-ribofuranosylaminobenzene 5'-phosphate synthase